jgi:hypothetical protein
MEKLGETKLVDCVLSVFFFSICLLLSVDYLCTYLRARCVLSRHRAIHIGDTLVGSSFEIHFLISEVGGPSG